MRRHLLLLMLSLIILLSLTACAGDIDVMATEDESVDSDEAATRVPATAQVATQGDEGAEANTVDTSGEIDYPSFTCNGQVLEQPFENGRMFWVGRTMRERCLPAHTFEAGSGEIWVLIFEQGNNGAWLRFADEWNPQTDPEFDPALEPPDERFEQPIRGFGYVWREVLTEDQRKALGWATHGEIVHVTEYAYDSGGYVTASGVWVPRPGVHTMLDFGLSVLKFHEGIDYFEYWETYPLGWPPVLEEITPDEQATSSASATP